MSEVTKDVASGDFSINYYENRLEDHILEHYHNACEIAFFIKARIQIFIKDTRYDIQDGDIIFIDEYNIHRIIYSKDTYYARYVINFKKEFMTNFLRVLNAEPVLEQLSRDSVVKMNLTLTERKELQTLFDILIKARKADLSRNTSITRTSVKSSLYMILASISEYMDNKAAAKKMNRKDSQVRQLIEFIDTNYSSSITLDLLAGKFFLSKFYISHIFKELSGFAISEYIQYRRVIEAQKMLSHSDKDIARISYDCGFNSVQHFYLVFKKISRISPLKYRHSVKKEK